MWLIIWSLFHLLLFSFFTPDFCTNYNDLLNNQLIVMLFLPLFLGFAQVLPFVKQILPLLSYSLTKFFSSFRSRMKYHKGKPLLNNNYNILRIYYGAGTSLSSFTGIIIIIKKTVGSRYDYPISWMRKLRDG